MTADPNAVPICAEIPELADLRRPRLRPDCPILWRDATTICFGDRAVVDNVTAAEVSWLGTLDGLRDPAQIAANLPVGAASARRLVRVARAVAAIEDAAEVPDSIRWTTPAARPAAWGRLGAAIDTARSIPAAFDVLATRAASPVAVLGTSETADLTRTAVGLAGLPLAERAAARVLLIAESTFPEALALDVDGPHLPIAVWGRRAVVGPLVDPGRSSCLRCAQMHRRDADLAWPLLSVQWAQATAAMDRQPVDLMLAGLAAMTAASLVRAWIDDPGPDWTDHALELSLPDGRPQVRDRPPHPLCGCRWSAAR